MWSSLRLLPVHEWGFGRVAHVRVPIFIPAEPGDRIHVTELGPSGVKIRDVIYRFADGGYTQQDRIGSPLRGVSPLTVQARYL
jgi:hypothetical protein